LVGGDYLPVVAADFFAFKSRRRGHVAGVVHDIGTLGGLRVASTPNARRPALTVQFRGAKSNIQHQTSNILIMVARLLSLARVRFSGQRTNCMGTAAHCWSDNYSCERLAVGSAFQIPGRNFIDARCCRALGNPGLGSNSRGILCDWNRAACGPSVARHDGRPRREFVGNICAATTVLLWDSLRQFFSLVDQIAMVDPQIMAK